MSYGLQWPTRTRHHHHANASGQTTDRKQVEYRYDPQGIRFIATDYSYDLQTSNFILQTSTEYLIDHSNFTGYAQTIIETTKDSLSNHQGASLTPTPRRSHANNNRLRSHNRRAYIFHHTHFRPRRARLNASPLRTAAAIAQVYTYSAYGELLAHHNSPWFEPHVSSLTPHLCSLQRRPLDKQTGMYNFRARCTSRAMAVSRG